MAVMKVVSPFPAAEYTGQNAAEIIEVANSSGAQHTIQSQGNGQLTIVSEFSTWTLNVGEVIIGQVNGWGMVLPRANFDQLFVEV